MTRYYFISYIVIENGNTAFGHCLMTVTDKNLTQICEMIQNANGFSNCPTIISMRAMGKREYEMLSATPKCPF